MSDQLLKEHRIKKNISNKKFGYQLASIFIIILLFRIVFFKVFNLIDYFLLSLGFLFLVISKYKPNYIIPVKTFWMKFAIYLSKVLNPIILFIIYLICFLPIGIYYKLVGKNNLKTKIDKNLNSYWEKPEDEKIDFKEQF